MKLASAAALAAAALLVGGDSRRSPTPALLVAKTDLALRAAPDGGAPVRDTLAAGASFEIAVRQGKWALVRSQKQWGWAVEPDLVDAQ